MTNGTSQGLFVVVAIILFGIFVLISHLLFKDNLKQSLTNIFKDSLIQTDNTIKEIHNIKAIREDKHYLYAKIRKESPSLNETEIWIQAKKNKDGTLTLYQSSIHDNAYSCGDSNMTGNLILPDAINNKKITSIRHNSSCGTFEKARFNGNLVLPKKLKSVGRYAFSQSSFSGELKIPISLTNIDSFSFTHSNFTGTLDISHVDSIQSHAFYFSKLNKIIRGNVPMSDDSSYNNTEGIHPKAIQLSNGSFYNGKNA
ncbi:MULTISPECIES: leucine-rich repeat protein [Enterococcus]|uniref:leucine-rich repeat protein n=1 Tax=Enterococcus TaxID=1350 RepID=UPI000CF1005D|nr:MULTISPECIES: leucine-rich repeat protein [Enterococcus]EGO2798460.1 leucine-rich repeat protein [Enterococcus faecalis]EGO2827310.1 leucine-rich repeat protein [Enterococcus faecalis]EGO5138202.1 leucine-rich repeat protein [Enterococcus faecalis]EGO5821714.1 leucine-rich repeat protein [Enterococcus faecalis]EGO5835550.1 leucine-rich repeat protein [Enterococcus faecalis]